MTIDDSTASMDSEATHTPSRSAFPPSAEGKRNREGKEVDQEQGKAEPGRESGRDTDEEHEQERDEDGVALEDGIPIVRLTGEQDPFR